MLMISELVTVLSVGTVELPLMVAEEVLSVSPVDGDVDDIGPLEVLELSEGVTPVLLPTVEVGTGVELLPVIIGVVAEGVISVD